MKKIEYLKISLCCSEINKRFGFRYISLNYLSIKTIENIDKKLCEHSIYDFRSFYNLLMEEYFYINNKLDNGKKKK